MPNRSPLFQAHHAIEQQTLSLNVLLQALEQNGRFSMHAQSNLINMPGDRALAQALGVSPHNGRPIKNYQIGLSDSLNDLAATRDGQAALSRDAAALDRVSSRVNRLGDVVQLALVNGDLRTNRGAGESIESARSVTKAFFADIDGYSDANVTQLSLLRQASPSERQWAVVTHSEQRVISTLQIFHTSGQPLAAGGDLELQRHGLSQAIRGAHQSGRLSLSARGVSVIENTLGEEVVQGLRVNHRQSGAVSMELLLGEGSGRPLVRAGGLLATGIDASIAARRSAELLDQGNVTAAQSEVSHAVARNVGGWAGGASMAMALGGSGYVPAAIVAADALLLARAFEKGADLLDNRLIYHQTSDGVAWQFDGSLWYRDAAFQGSSSGSNDIVDDRVSASYEKSQQLGAMATAKAVEIALGRAPVPQDPFRIPARASDQRGLDNQDWQRNPDTSIWERQVRTGVSGANDRTSYETQVASPERSQQLNDEALERIEFNIGNGSEAIAARYLQNYAALRSEAYGVVVPTAVEAARARPDVVVGSDGERYHRNEAGHWAGGDGLASGNLAMELELTSQMRQPSLERLQQEVADLRAMPHPTAEQAEHSELLHRYLSSGVDLNVNPDTQLAIALAVQRTMDVNSITGSTMQRLQPTETGHYGFDSPIIHYQTGKDGVAHQVAVTGSAELRQAWSEIQARRDMEAPLPDTPERHITALSAHEREAHDQALREANRDGRSTDEAYRIAAAAAQAAVHHRIDDALDSELPQRQAPTSKDPAVAGVTAISPPAVTRAATPAVPPQSSGELERPTSQESTHVASRVEMERAQASRQAEEVARQQSDNEAENTAPTSDRFQADPVGLSSVLTSATPAPQHAVHSRTQPFETPETGLAGDSRPRSAPAEAATSSMHIEAEPESALQQNAVPQVAQPTLHSEEQYATTPPVDAGALAEDDSAPSPVADVEILSPLGASTHDSPHVPEEPQSKQEAELSENQGSGAVTRSLPQNPVESAQPLIENPTSPSKIPPTHRDHPDHMLYEHVRDCVADLDAQLGRAPDENSERLTASLLVLAKENGLDRVDHVVLSQATANARQGQNVFVVQGEMNDPAQKRAGMPTEQAVNTPTDESMQQFDVVAEEQQARAQQLAQQQQDEDQRVQHEMQIAAASMGY